MPLHPIPRCCLGLPLLAFFQVIQTGFAQPLQTAHEIRSLAPELAAQSLSATVRGVVLGQAEPFGESVVLFDGTDSLYARGPAGVLGTYAPGDVIEVRGYTASGGFAPLLRAESATKTGTAPLPEPEKVSSDDLFTRGLDARWVVVSGVVRDLRVTDFGVDPSRPSYQPGPYRVIMTLAVGDRCVSIQDCNRVDPEQIVDAEVEVRGICFNLHNVERQFLRPLILVPQGIDIRITRPAPAGPFDLPVVSSRSLFRFRPEGSSLHRVRIDGIVLHQVRGVGLWVRDGLGGLFVRSEQETTVQPGDRVHVAGFPEHGEFAPVLSHAIYELSGTDAAPRPVALTEVDQAALHHDDLVRVEGELTGRLETSAGTILHLQTLGTTIEVVCNASESSPDMLDWQIGSTLAATGICRLATLQHERPPSGILVPDKFTMLTRDPTDIAVVERAPWWTPGRLAVLLVGMVATLAVVLVAVFVLSRKRLNRERARRALEVSAVEARLAERSQLARDLHDTLAQGLGAISLHLDLAGSSVTPAEPDGASRHISIAHQLVRTSILEVRSFIRNLRTQTQQDMTLESILRDLQNTAIEGSGLRATLRIEGETWPLDRQVKEQVTRLAQEAIANAVRHSDGTQLIVSARFSPASLVVSVQDDGKGFIETADSIRPMHFGLLGMRERAQLIGADLSIESADGAGTRVVLTVSRHAVITDSINL